MTDKKNKKIKKERFTLLGTIKGKLYLSVFFTVISLFFVSATAFYKANEMAEAGENIYTTSLKGVELVGKIKSQYQDARGSIARAPAELDLTNVSALSEDAIQKIDLALNLINEHKSISTTEGQDILSSIESILHRMKESGEKVFGYAQLFAADQATQELEGNFKAVEEDMETQLLVMSLHEEEQARQSFNALINAQKAMYTFIAAILGLSVLLAGGSGLMIARGIATRTNTLSNLMRNLAKGDVSQEVLYAEDKDEIGQMARAVLIFKENKIEADRLNAEQDQQRQAQLDRAKNVDVLTAQFETGISEMTENLREATDRLQETAQNMKSLADRTEVGTTSIAGATEESASNVNSVAAATEELTASIQNIANQVKRSEEISSAAVTEVNDAASQVQGLADAADKIGEIVVLIQDIAEQTNLLALNATIEAARAGEAGKGFAVVASEVKTLANDTATATQNISTQITQIQAQTQNTVNSITQIANRINQIEEISNTISYSIQEQSTSTQEIAKNVQKAAQGAQEVSSNAQQISDAAREVGQVADTVLESGCDLSMQNDYLSKTVEEFLSDIKKA